MDVIGVLKIIPEEERPYYRSEEVPDVLSQMSFDQPLFYCNLSFDSTELIVLYQIFQVKVVFERLVAKHLFNQHPALISLAVQLDFRNLLVIKLL